MCASHTRRGFCRCTADKGNPTKEKCHHVMNHAKNGSTGNLISHLAHLHGINKESSSATKTGPVQHQLSFRRGEPWLKTKVIWFHSPPNASARATLSRKWLRAQEANVRKLQVYWQLRSSVSVSCTDSAEFKEFMGAVSSDVYDPPTRWQVAKVCARLLGSTLEGEHPDSLPASVADCHGSCSGG